jgi:decaprenyl-phosphate phosphoribosyltransferase
MLTSERASASLEVQEATAARGRVHAVLATARPRQWLKNLLVIAAPAAAGALGHDDVPVRVCLACAAFCMLASGIYAVNDVRDVDEDRLHPRKRRRPVAAGEISPRVALVTGVGSILAGLLLSTAIAPLLGVVALGYVALTISYTLVWRHVVGLDIVAIAGGFILRAVAGGVAAPVTLSRWFLLVITFAAILVAAGKRHAELRRVGPRPLSARRVLHAYRPSVLRAIIASAGAGAFVAYCVWAFELPAVRGVPWRPLTIVPFAIALGRYAVLVRAGDGEAPEDLLLGDRWLRALSLAWLVLFVVSVNFAN